MDGQVEGEELRLIDVGAVPATDVELCGGPCGGSTGGGKWFVSLCVGMERSGVVQAEEGEERGEEEGGEARGGNQPPRRVSMARHDVRGGE